jgi:signal transduction histidine kinase
LKRTALVFFVAIFLPSLVLGWLALRTAGEQNVLIERQAAALYQTETDLAAEAVRSALAARQEEFALLIQSLLTAWGASALAEDYAARVLEPWTAIGVPFAVAPGGALVCPVAARARSDAGTREFLTQNAAFLSNRDAVELYSQPPPSQGKAQALPQEEAAQSRSGTGKQEIRSDTKAGGQEAQRAQFSLSEPPPDPSILQSSKDKDAEASDALLKKQASFRNVIPQKQTEREEPQAPPISKIEPELSDFQSAVAVGSGGILSRFVQNELQLFFWSRPERADGYVFGIMIPASEAGGWIREAMAQLSRSNDEYCLAVLNEKAQPVFQSIANFAAEWKRPFVATEVGEVLPNWEVSLYLVDPARLTASARLVTLTVVLLIALALAAILAGGYFVATDTRRQLALAQKKTDFVSNVSHELKTPLTSIRMFAELLSQGRVDDPAKREHYLRIITHESERLTRLINNVLDFARIERNDKACDKKPADFFPVLERLWESHSAHLREAGFTCSWDADEPPYPVLADVDALSQVVVNLLSNAEKYSGERREITLVTRLRDRQLHLSVQDRGIGVPAGEERKIFDAFHRADDALSSGIQGSGLGLTLARRIATDHGGSILFERRDGGGSIFTLVLPILSGTPS